jgi:hypothetical protein
MTLCRRLFSHLFPMVSGNDGLLFQLCVTAATTCAYVSFVALMPASSILEFPHPGHYLLTGRVAVGCRRDATFLQVLEGGPVEGHRTQLYVNRWQLL